MTANRLRTALLIAATITLSYRPALADGTPYVVDILSSDYYPQLKDAYMYYINDNGLAAGYIATDTSRGPYLPATYSGGGRFTTYGLQSNIYPLSVTGLNDRGDLVGTLFDKDFNTTPFLVRDGVVSTTGLPADASPFLYGINNAGLAYGTYFDNADGLLKVYTLTGGTVTTLPLAAPGFSNWDSATRSLNNAGLLGVIGYSDATFDASGFLYHLATGALDPIALPDGFASFSFLHVLDSGLVFGEAFSADFSVDRLGFWGSDGSFLRFLDLPDGLRSSSVRFNDLGQAVGLRDGHLLSFDGSSWSERNVLDLNGYTLNSISDLNNRGEFVGLVRSPAGTFEWGFVARPVPGPGSILLSAVGLIGLGASRRADVWRRLLSRALRPIFTRSARS
jgi:hypothetical protein